jgi:hypothetical protein
MVGGKVTPPHLLPPRAAWSIIMFLTAEEVAELTGYTKSGAQIKWLQAEKYGFAIDGYGKPKVLRQVVIGRLGGIQSKKGPELRLA